MRWRFNLSDRQVYSDFYKGDVVIGAAVLPRGYAIEDLLLQVHSCPVDAHDLTQIMAFVLAIGSMACVTVQLPLALPSAWERYAPGIPGRSWGRRVFQLLDFQFAPVQAVALGVRTSLGPFR